ncbi:MAG: protein kinase [Pirellulales bacterium]
MGRTSDRNLLFGVLAVRMEFLTRAQLFEGMQAWINDKAVPLGDHLVRLGYLNAARRALLDPLVDEHVRQHDGDPHKSLAALDSVSAFVDELRNLRDDDVNRSLATFAPARSSSSPASNDPYATTAPDPYATQVTAQGENLDVRLGKSAGDAARFRIIRPHAEGGLGSVYVARDTELDRDVALKEIQFDKADNVDNRNRFTLEAEITGGLEHPGIVPVYGLGTYADGRPYYAMKFIRGDSLKDAIDVFHKGAGQSEDVGARNLRLRKLLQRFIDVCEAIDYAHTRGVLHRDLKPGNIMLGRHGETLVVDWGLAKPLGKTPQQVAQTPATSPQATSASSTTSAHPSVDAPHANATDDPSATLGPSSDTLGDAFDNPLLPRSKSDSTDATLDGSVLGTPAFMSPEQAQGRVDLLGPASDIFGLGATLYELLVGRPPYQAKTVHEVLALARQAKYPTPRACERRRAQAARRDLSPRAGRRARGSLPDRASVGRRRRTLPRRRTGHRQTRHAVGTRRPLGPPSPRRVSLRNRRPRLVDDWLDRSGRRHQRRQTKRIRRAGPRNDRQERSRPGQDQRNGGQKRGDRGQSPRNASQKRRRLRATRGRTFRHAGPASVGRHHGDSEVRRRQNLGRRAVPRIRSAAWAKT